MDQSSALAFWLETTSLNIVKSNYMEIKPDLETFARLKVVGVGGSGGNAINRMMASDIKGVEFIAINTDAQALQKSNAPHRIHIGKNITKGLGAGMDPEVGRQAAEESRDEIAKTLKGSDMVFITCGLGGGTGTGASPVVANLAREAGILTVGVITKPFAFEGLSRKNISEQGLVELAKEVDTLITIPNDRLLQVIDKSTSLLEAFEIVDDILRQGVQGISDLIVVPGIVNVDFADVKAVMRDAGSALMGIGRASGEERAREAARAAISSPLLELSIDGAKGVLFNITGGADLGMYEIEEAAKVITESVYPEAKIIFGAVIDPEMEGELKITVIATGFEGKKKEHLVEGQKDDDIFAPPPREEIKVKVEDKIDVRPSDLTPQVRKAGSPRLRVEGDEDEDELDIPAFIRKKMAR